MTQRSGRARSWNRKASNHGQKISGGYALIRTGGDDERSLLIKMDDDEADARRNPVSTEPESVKTGRTLEEIRQEAAEDS